MSSQSVTDFENGTFRPMFSMNVRKNPLFDAAKINIIKPLLEDIFLSSQMQDLATTKLKEQDFKIATCLICQEKCLTKCDKCLRAICSICKEQMNDEISTEQAHALQSCKWCIGVSDPEEFCIRCSEAWDKKCSKELRLGEFILSKKYGPQENLQAAIMRRNPWICSHHCGTKCSCMRDARDRVRARYGIGDFRILDHYPTEEGWDGEYDMCGSICTYCQRKRFVRLNYDLARLNEDILSFI